MFFSSKHLPEAPGPYVPGFADVMVGYSQKGFLVRLYYPTNCSHTDKDLPRRWKTWLPDNSYITGLAKVLMIFPLFLRLLLWWTGHHKVPAVQNERLLSLSSPSEPKKLNCAIFSHGLGANRFIYSNICCELASRGFVVACIEHRDSSACNTFYFNSLEAAQQNARTNIAFKHILFDEEHFKKRREQVEQRAEECGQVVEFLLDLQKGKSPKNVLVDCPGRHGFFNLEDFTNRLDIDNIVMMGHSFGGATALLALEQRNELKIGVLFDPWMFPIKDHQLCTKLDKPLIFLNTQTFHIQNNINAIEKYLNNKENRQIYTILHTTHEHQTDSVLLIGSWLNWFMKKLKPENALKINNALTLKFLDNFLQIKTPIKDCIKILEKEQDNYEAGLTKAWA